MTALPKRKIFTGADYHKMIDAGVFTGDPHYELIEGEIVKTLPIGDYHASCVNRLNRIFSRNCGDDIIVSIQNPVIISEITEPEPDVALLRFREDFYASGKATAEDVLLLIEVSDSTVSYDRNTKMRLYAEAGISESWLVNLPRQILEIYTDPKDGKYKLVKKAGKKESVSPKFIKDLKLKVSDIIG